MGQGSRQRKLRFNLHMRTYDEIQHINGRHTLRKGVFKYKARWKGFTRREDTWHFESDLPKESIQDFKEKCVGFVMKSPVLKKLIENAE